MNSHDEVRAFIPDPVLQQRLAKYMVLQCFRNSMLEDLHAGISPSSASGDYGKQPILSLEKFPGQSQAGRYLPAR